MNISNPFKLIYKGANSDLRSKKSLRLMFSGTPCVIRKSQNKFFRKSIYVVFIEEIIKDCKHFPCCTGTQA